MTDTTTKPRTYNLPRNVRPSFVTVSVDGRDTKIATGPKARSGRMSIAVALRDTGGIIDDAVTVDAIAAADGLTPLALRSQLEGLLAEVKA
jgi:hypothetical protein